MPVNRRHRRRRVYRRRRTDRGMTLGGLHLTWAQLSQFFTIAVAAIGLYVGISNKIAVQTSEILHLKEAAQDFKSQVQSIRDNMTGLERYIVNLHNNEQHR